MPSEHFDDNESTDFTYQALGLPPPHNLRRFGFSSHTHFPCHTWDSECARHQCAGVPGVGFCSRNLGRDGLGQAWWGQSLSFALQSSLISLAEADRDSSTSHIHSMSAGFSPQISRAVTLLNRVPDLNFTLKCGVPFGS